MSWAVVQNGGPGVVALVDGIVVAVGDVVVTADRDVDVVGTVEAMVVVAPADLVPAPLHAANPKIAARTHDRPAARRLLVAHAEAAGLRTFVLA